MWNIVVLYLKFNYCSDVWDTIIVIPEDIAHSLLIINQILEMDWTCQFNIGIFKI